jgi:hypothetical protein
VQEIFFEHAVQTFASSLLPFGRFLPSYGASFAALLFVSNTLYVSKIDKMREFLNKNYLTCFLYGFLKII